MVDGVMVVDTIIICASIVIWIWALMETIWNMTSEFEVIEIIIHKEGF